MAHQTGMDKEYDLDLDSRKMVLIFFGFLAICGCFFVAGYVIGNKADSRAVNYADTSIAGNSRIKDNSGVAAPDINNEIVRERASVPPAVTEPSPAEPTIQIPAATVSNNVVTDAVQYEPQETATAVSAAEIPAVAETPASSLSSNTTELPPKEIPNKTAAGSTVDEKTATAAKVNAPAKQAAAAKVAYAVQVAAFRARREVEIKARELEVKGFEPRIEPPQTPGDYYRLKVGSFATRAEASELAKQLVEKGFETMITEIK